MEDYDDELGFRTIWTSDCADLATKINWTIGLLIFYAVWTALVVGAAGALMVAWIWVMDAIGIL